VEVGREDRRRRVVRRQFERVLAPLLKLVGLEQLQRRRGVFASSFDLIIHRRWMLLRIYYIQSVRLFFFV